MRNDLNIPPLLFFYDNKLSNNSLKFRSPPARLHSLRAPAVRFAKYYTAGTLRRARDLPPLSYDARAYDTRATIAISNLMLP